MEKVISTERIPIKLWLNDIEEGVLEQVKNLANLPFSFKHISIMPDSHQGYGMPIGAVMATKNIVVPNAVGVDIGCGMCAVKTLFKTDKFTTPILKELVEKIKEVIPVGFNKHDTEQDNKLMPDLPDISPIVWQEKENALKSLGTLGGGNHFIEIQKDKDDYVWIMIHSGSRNLGLKVATHYNKLAVELNEKWHSQVPKNWELAFLPLDTLEGQMYLKEMNYCIEYALANRKLMLERIKKIISEIASSKTIFDTDFMRSLLGNSEIGSEYIINIAHNYARMENHFGSNVMVHRKGATLAIKDTIGIIPSSQGTKSYIVKGKGNIDSFNSCSHGAGRVMGRKEAIKTLNLDEEIKKLDDKGIIHGLRGKNNLDEASSSYKDIDVVMRNQEDLVEILVELEPLAVVKG